MDARTPFTSLDARLPTAADGAWHLSAAARLATIAFDGVARAKIFKKTFCAADLKPAGRDLAKDMPEVAGIPLLMKPLLDHGYLQGHDGVVIGRTIAEFPNCVKWNPHQDVVRSADRAVNVIAHPDGAHEKQFHANI
jgi:dihydroxy-acid dehydratase